MRLKTLAAISLTAIGALLLAGCSTSSQSSSEYSTGRENPEPKAEKPKWQLVVIAATFVGILTGLFGIGGGFMIVPALILFLRVPTKVAAGTSLVAITANSLLAFVMRYEFWGQIPVLEITVFTVSAISASLILSPVATKLNTKILQKIFSLVIVLVAIYTLVTNLN